MMLITTRKLALGAIVVSLPIAPVSAQSEKPNTVTSSQNQMQKRGSDTASGAARVAKDASVDPVDRFSETRIGHILFYPAHGDRCRRVLFDNATGKTYDAPDINCVSSEMNTRPVPGRPVNQSRDRLDEMSKYFKKR
jgi:hypothetical protein